MPHASEVQPPSTIASIPVEQGELWTSRQRQASSLHEVSYRACFKPQLPKYFIDRYSSPGDLIYDPFAGRGTTAVEAALLGRKVISNDLNPLSEILCRPRLEVPDLDEVKGRLESIPFRDAAPPDIDLSMFYHPDTLRELVLLRTCLLERRKSGSDDSADRWIAMVATNRLTGHSKGFFSVYSLPPNQAVSPERQIKINIKLKQTPEYRDVKGLILRKSKSLLSDLTDDDIRRLRDASSDALFLSCPASSTSAIKDASVALAVTSPPFLNVVQYSLDNWLRCWFNGIDVNAVGSRLSLTGSLPEWKRTMSEVFKELFRVLKPGGHVAFEVGEVRKGSVRLEEHVIEAATPSGLVCERIVINTQSFTKTSNIWGVSNNSRGTNSNRIALLRKP